MMLIKTGYVRKGMKAFDAIKGVEFTADYRLVLRFFPSGMPAYYPYQVRIFGWTPFLWGWECIEGTKHVTPEQMKQVEPINEHTPDMTLEEFRERCIRPMIKRDIAYCEKVLEDGIQINAIEGKIINPYSIETDPDKHAMFDRLRENCVQPKASHSG